MESTSTILRMLSNIHRRRLLFLLVQVDSVQIPEGIRTRRTTPAHGQSEVSSEDGTRESPPEAQNPDRLEIAVTHNHLPKLEAENLIDWDRETQTVTKGTEFEEIEPILMTLTSNADVFSDDLL